MVGLEVMKELAILMKEKDEYCQAKELDNRNLQFIINEYQRAEVERD